jgi:hypothetical protein
MGLIAAVLLLAGVMLAVAGRSAHAAPGDREARGTVHYCAATDKQFLDVARLNVELVRTLGGDYIQGSEQGSVVIGASRDAVKALHGTSPADPALTLAKRYFESMFVEYGRAVQTREDDADASGHMYRAYSLEEYARHVLLLAAPPLRKLGCDVYDLL